MPSRRMLGVWPRINRSMASSPLALWIASRTASSTTTSSWMPVRPR